VFNLRPPPKACPNTVCPWTETVLHRFTGGSDGSIPGFGDLIFDRSGNIYGTTTGGGPNFSGTVFELTPSHGGWTENVLYNFTGVEGDGAGPYSGLVFDQTGNLYGTTAYGGNIDACIGGLGCGTVFELTLSGSGWTENILYTFQGGNDGGWPAGGLIFDQAANLYGDTTSFGGGECGWGNGTVFMMSYLNGQWSFSALADFADALIRKPAISAQPGPGNCGPYASLVLDAAGNLYGTTTSDGAYGRGSVLELTNLGWTLTSLHDFAGGSDGAYPISNVIFDAGHNLYGTADEAGIYGYGVVWEITP
jgi:uncharacterized repeat protein (TIGR03803 family)